MVDNLTEHFTDSLQFEGTYKDNITHIAFYVRKIRKHDNLKKTGAVDIKLHVQLSQLNIQH